MAALTLNLSPQDLADRRSILELDRILHLGAPSIVGVNGEQLRLPDGIYRSLETLVEMMLQGKSVAVVAEDQAVSTQRAAHLLGMSRPYFIKLLDAGAMAHHRVGNQRRVHLHDVLSFLKKRDQERELALDRLSRDAFENGLYDRNELPEGVDCDESFA